MTPTEILHSYMSGPLAVLALWEPWAVLCVAPDPAHDGQPGKAHETRHWYPRTPRPFAVAIHAAKRFDASVKLALDDTRFRDALKRCGYFPGDPRPFLDRKMAPPVGKAIPLGAIVGLARVVGISSAQNVDMSDRLAGVTELDLATITPDDRAFGFFTILDSPVPEEQLHKVRFAWQLADTVLLPGPIPHIGRQDALYPVDGDLRERINQQLRWMEMAE